jgi:sulfur transfer protein SufE
MTADWFAANLPPAERERDLIERHLIIADPQERLQVLCGRHHGTPTLPENQRTDTLLVRECSSALWLRATVQEDRLLSLELASNSPMIRSLAGIHADLAHLADASLVRDFSPDWLRALHVDRFLSASRQQGLAAVWRRIQALDHFSRTNPG